MLLGAGAVNAQPADDAAEAAKAAALTRKIDALGVVWKDVESHPLGSDDRKKYLREFLDKSELVWTIPPDHRSLDGLWTMRALAAYELDLKREAWEAGDAMVRLGLDRSDNDLIRKTLAQLERKGLLDPEAPDVKRFVQERQQLKEARGHANPVDALKAQAILDKLLQAAPDHRPALALREQIKPWVQELNPVATFAWADAASGAKLIDVDGKKYKKYPSIVVEKQTGMRLVLIPAGEFQMGSPNSESERESDETQHRRVIRKAFYLGETEVTQAQWQQVMGSNPSNFQGPENPVEQVSWNDCQEFVQKLNARGVGFRLPSEAEWEYACRAGTKTPFSFGGNITPAQVNYAGNYPYNGAAKGQYRQKTVPVRILPANAFGLHEMHGNVFEWCEDTFAAYPGTGTEEPTRGEGSRVLRGGSWGDRARNCRSANRGDYDPANRDVVIGFRLSRTLQ